MWCLSVHTSWWHHHLFYKFFWFTKLIPKLIDFSPTEEAFEGWWGEKSSPKTLQFSKTNTIWDLNSEHLLQPFFLLWKNPNLRVWKDSLHSYGALFIIWTKEARGFSSVCSFKMCFFWSLVLSSTILQFFDQFSGNSFLWGKHKWALL